MCRKHITPLQRATVYVRDGNCCVYCGTELHIGANTNDPKAATVDHYHPHSGGGSDAVTNLVAACYRCNRRKSDASPRGWYSLLRLEGHTEKEIQTIQRRAARRNNDNLNQAARKAATTTLAVASND
ncbi:MAG: hypothetical protein CMK74_15070 [Pseudomonadales bacterium]|nr:hypothetical protein [Pseudomonadales bacterium]